MENFNINTAQNVELSNRIAGLGNRMLASLFDFIILFMYFIFLFVIISIFDAANINQGQTIGIILGFIISIPVIFYNIFFEVFFEGQTIGKKIMKIKVVRLDGGKPKFYHYFVRWIFRLVDIYTMMGGIAVFSIAFTKKGQRLGDVVAGTTVIKLNQKSLLTDTIFATVDENYQVQFQNINLLNDNDITIVKEVLDLVVKNPTAKNITLSYETKNKIEQVLGIQTDYEAKIFLNTIISDYNFVNRNQV